MIVCNVCKHENDDYVTVCVQCKGYIQNRIPNLDFFDTVWNVIESPRRAFHDITLAEHKNYSLLLFSLFGVALSFAAFWYFQMGNRFDSLLDLLSRATLLGIGVGYIAAFVFTFTVHAIISLFGGRKGIRNTLAVLAYSTTPIAISLVTILPIELLTFGMYMFTANPHPYTIKPDLYIVLLGFDVGLSLWALALAIAGFHIGKRMKLWQSALAVLIGGSISMTILFLLAKYLLI
jgi:hypothetical protein